LLRREQAPGGRKPVVAAALPLEPPGIGRDGKAHAAFHRLDAEMVEHRREIGIVQFVIDDEAGVDRDLFTVIVDDDGVATVTG
jgi:hypothetical protein